MATDKREAAALLAEDILSNIELSDITLAAVMLKCARLARLLGDETRRQIFAYEAGGYPHGPDGIPSEAFELGRIAGRVFEEKDSKTQEVKERMRTGSVAAIEQINSTNQLALSSAADPNVSITSANPNQMVWAPIGNSQERKNLRVGINSNAAILAQSRSFAYDYASSVFYQLEFSNAASDVFDKSSEKIDNLLIRIAPDAARKTASINENLSSDNPEDWANAVHGCRRLLQAVADQIFPPAPARVVGNKTIQLGPDHYINRLMAYVEDRAGSQRFREIVGTTLAYLGERLDALFKAAQKGSHANIDSREEAERYVIYTYMIVGDILSLDSAA